MDVKFINDQQLNTVGNTNFHPTNNRLKHHIRHINLHISTHFPSDKTLVIKDMNVNAVKKQTKVFPYLNYIRRSAHIHQTHVFSSMSTVLYVICALQ